MRRKLGTLCTVECMCVWGGVVCIHCTRTSHLAAFPTFSPGCRLQMACQPLRPSMQLEDARGQNDQDLNVAFWLGVGGWGRTFPEFPAASPRKAKANPEHSHPASALLDVS